MPLTIELARTAPADVAATAVGAVAGQSEGGGRRLGPPGRSQGFEGEEGRRPRRARRRTGAPRSSSGSGPADEVDADVLRSAAGAAGPRRQAARRRSPSTCSARCPTAPTARRRGAGDRRGPRARRLPVLRRSSPTPSRSKLERVVLVGGGGKRVADRDRPGAGRSPRRCAGRATWRTSPAARSRPAKLAKQAVAEGARAGFEVTVWDEKEIRKQKLGGLLGVNRGSEQARSVPAPGVRAGQGDAAPSRSSARASPSTPAACR